MERYDIIQKSLRKEITVPLAAKQCDISERQLYRLRKRIKKHGVKGVIHKNTGKTSNNAFSAKERREMRSIVKEHYADFGPTLAAEKLLEDHDITVSNQTLRTLMVGWGLWQAKSRKENGEHRQWRERRQCFGEMEQFDGCYHAWFEDRADTCCLLAAIDDATGNITGLRFVDWEGVFPSFEFWEHYIDTHGKPLAIYLDRHSTYKVNAKTLLDDPESRSQFGRACEELSIELIHAHSPEAKGRIERLFKTLQDRLVKELRLCSISDRETANAWMEKEFIPSFNAKFGVVPRSAEDAHRQLTEVECRTRDRIFAKRMERVVANDFTVRYAGRFFQLEKTSVRLVRKREKVEIEEHADGSMKIALRDAYLPHHELPERPQKQAAVLPKLLAHIRAPHVPAQDHPWRKAALFARNLPAKNPTMTF